ncbi:glycosyl hydrolase [Cryptosporidium andersoni]|uniref:Glycosyl hydrolase n=1 Tax=Cryptosporidium andersoni TaxID=117008 RepID=A0A1J4MUJ0_9CRYT|nr:glycosyl hydrolase [Cryptosporidium andersoni]
MYIKGFCISNIISNIVFSVNYIARFIIGTIDSFKNKSIFRTGKSSPFIIRYKKFCKYIKYRTLSPWHVKPGSVRIHSYIGINNDNLNNIENSTLSLLIYNPLSPEISPLKVLVNAYSFGCIRLKIDEIKPLINFKRFKFETNEVIMDSLLDNFLINNNNDVELDINDMKGIVKLSYTIDEYSEKLYNQHNNTYKFKNTENKFTIIINFSPFSIETFFNNENIHTINYNGHFNFERVRPLMKIDKKEDSIHNNKIINNMKIDEIFKFLQIKERNNNFIYNLLGIIIKYFGYDFNILNIKNDNIREYRLSNQIIDAYSIYNNNGWFDVFDGYPDYKVYGPTAVGTDIRFHLTHNIYGGAERSTDINLDEYEDSYRFYNLDVFTYEYNKPNSLYGNIPILMGVYNNEYNEVEYLNSNKKDCLINKNIDDNKYKKNCKISGILWNNPSDTFMNIRRGRLSKIFSKTRNELYTDSWWISETGIMDILLWMSDSIKNFYFIYHMITGFPMLTPRFALGKHQSRWNYFTQEEVLELSESFNKFKIPMDAIWLDIEHLDKRQCFTWNKTKFPDIELMLNKLDDKNRTLVIIADPHIKIQDLLESEENEYFVYNILENIQDTHELEFDTCYKELYSISKLSNWVKVYNNEQWKDFIGLCWPGKVKYPDFLNPYVLDIYSKFYIHKYYSKGLNLEFWIDMNEPSVFSSPELTLPKYSFHYKNIEHRQVHNIYGLNHLKSTFRGILTANLKLITSRCNNEDYKKLEIDYFKEEKFNNIFNKDFKYDEKNYSDLISKFQIIHEEDIWEICDLYDIQRPYILTRSFYIGSHRFGYVWTGDNESSWKSYQAVIPMNLINSICGISYTGSDVGGFYGHPCSCLFIYWHKLAIWFPFYRSHSHIDSPRREPWAYNDEVLDIVRQQILLRYELITFWYTATSIYSFKGEPIITPVLWIAKSIGQMDEIQRKKIENSSFIVADIFLISIYSDSSFKKCRCSEDHIIQPIYLPLITEDTIWYEFKKLKYHIVQSSKHFVDYSYKLKDYTPCFVKQSSIITLQKDLVHSSKLQSKFPIQIEIFLPIYQDSPIISTGKSYLDDGQSYNYLKGEFLCINWKVKKVTEFSELCNLSNTHTHQYSKSNSFEDEFEHSKTQNVYEFSGEYESINLINPKKKQFQVISSDLEVIKNKWSSRMDLNINTIIINGLKEQPKNIYFFKDKTKKYLEFTIEKIVPDTNSEFGIYKKLESLFQLVIHSTDIKIDNLDWNLIIETQNTNI